MSTTHPGVDRSAPAEGRATGFRRGLLIALLAVLLVATGALLWLAASRLGNDQEDLQKQREQVMLTTQSFMERIGNHDPTMLDDKGQMPDYRRSVEELATTKLKAQLEGQDFALAEKLTAKFGLVRVTKVYATSVQSIDADSATVLVVGTVADTYSRQQAAEPQAFRFAVQLQKVDGTWLVDSFDRVEASS